MQAIPATEQRRAPFRLAGRDTGALRVLMRPVENLTALTLPGMGSDARSACAASLFALCILVNLLICR